jgi:ferric-dicitrate binding protein FerR (iron transport regulator)
MKPNLMVPPDCGATSGSRIPRSSESRRSFYMSNTSVDADMTNDDEQPVTLARIVFLAAVALPVLGGLYYALLLQRRSTAASRRIPLSLGERVRLNGGSPIGLVVDTGERVTIAWPAGEATFPQESLRRV